MEKEAEANRVLRAGLQMEYVTRRTALVAIHRQSLSMGLEC